MDTQTESRRLPAIGGAAVGAMLAFTMLPWSFVVGIAGLWQQPKHDFYAYLTAWNYFIRDEWRVPLLDVPAMGYPEGGNLIYSDAIPAAQIASKLAYSAGWTVNPFGWWAVLTYILQGAMAVRVVRAAGVRSGVGWVAAAILATAYVPFMTRVWHLALSSQFLLLWALALYLENARGRRFSARQHLFLSALTLLVSAYLFAMVSAIQAVTVLVLARQRRLAARDVATLALGIVGVIALGLLIGYGRMLVDPGSARASGFGALSWNPATLVLPPDGAWPFLGRLPRMRSLEQAEGESYLGLGGVLVIAACLLAKPRQAARAVRRHALFTVLLVLLGLYALTNRIVVGPFLLAEVPLPSLVTDLGAFFRASGRFIWVPAYALLLLSLAGLLRWCPRRFALPVVMVAALLQLIEARSTREEFRVELAGPGPDQFDVARVGGWLAHHERLFQFPSFSCQPPRTSEDTFRELQIELMAARMNVPNNSIYTSRQLKDCGGELRWALEGKPQQDTLYVLQKRNTDAQWAAAAARLRQSLPCVDLGWGLICSRHPLPQ
jgi:hypothetical protein